MKDNKSIIKERKIDRITIQAGIRAGFWVAFGAGGGDLQITPKSSGSLYETQVKQPPAGGVSQTPVA